MIQLKSYPQILVLTCKTVQWLKNGDHLPKNGSRNENIFEIHVQCHISWMLCENCIKTSWFPWLADLPWTDWHLWHLAVFHGITVSISIMLYLIRPIFLLSFAKVRDKVRPPLSGQYLLTGLCFLKLLLPSTNFRSALCPLLSVVFLDLKGVKWHKFASVCGFIVVLTVRKNKTVKVN